MLNVATNVTFGSDPEGFFSKGKAIIGSEKLIPVKGITVKNHGGIARDGVQFELHPVAGSIPHLLTNIRGCLLAAQDLAKSYGAELNFNGVVEVDRAEFESLSPSSQVLGCTPSKNVYGDKPVNVDPYTYPKRSAGGHIHIGYTPKDKRTTPSIISLFDVIVGNTCVLFDRDPNAAERRENYGRAGEYRTPYYGFEYRTLSNFWMRDPTLATFAFGLAKLGMSIWIKSYSDKDIWNDLVKLVNIHKVQKAIDTNDYDLAKQNLLGLEPYLAKHITNTTFVLNAGNLSKLLKIANTFGSKSIDKIFPTKNILSRWTEYSINKINSLEDYFTKRN